MKVKVCCIASLLILCLAADVYGTAYIMPLPSVIGNYENGTVARVQVDFNQRFSSIQDLRISLAGDVFMVWWDPGDPRAGGPLPNTGWFFSTLYESVSYVGKSAGTHDLGLNGSSFAETCTFNPMGDYTSWDMLLDGKATLDVEFMGTYQGSPVQPTATLNSATLIINATPVPEPASAITLVAGLLGCAASGRCRIKRR